MASLATRYADGEHEQVWREINAQDLPLTERYALRGAPSEAEIEDVMRQTFERVARNVDRLIERLPDYGYLFECEAGRHGDPVAPRSDASFDARQARKRVEDACAGMSEFATCWPLALTVFADVVGTVNLCQRNSETAAASWDEQQKSAEVLTDPKFLSRLPPETAEQIRQSVARNEAFLRKQIETEPPDPGPHPFANDPVLEGLGDWDPLEVSFDYLSSCLDESTREMTPLGDGGLSVSAEFAASFEHKANYSGAENPWFAFPANRVDPIVRAEGIRLPFSTYLRRVFARGGFFGVPRPVRQDSAITLREVEQGIWLPDHSVFADLAAMMEPF